MHDLYHPVLEIMIQELAMVLVVPPDIHIELFPAKLNLMLCVFV